MICASLALRSRGTSDVLGSACSHSVHHVQHFPACACNRIQARNAASRSSFGTVKSHTCAEIGSGSRKLHFPWKPERICMLLQPQLAGSVCLRHHTVIHCTRGVHQHSLLLLGPYTHWEICTCQALQGNCAAAPPGCHCHMHPAHAGLFRHIHLRTGPHSIYSSLETCYCGKPMKTADGVGSCDTDRLK